MSSIHPCSLPADALLGAYAGNGAYTDCYATDIPIAVSHAQYVSAFYTTRVFKFERLILKWAVSKPSTDAQAELLATGAIDSFAAWNVERRAEDQLLMCDFQGRTRSWLMVAPAGAATGIGSRLYFGSAVVPRKHPKTGRSTLGGGFEALLGFHKTYSRVLLHAARSQLAAARP
ncbi:MAG: hypothetical protein ACREV5_01090 [Steroidobacter sp.]